MREAKSTYTNSVLVEGASWWKEGDHFLQTRGNGMDWLADEENGVACLDFFVCWESVSEVFVVAKFRVRDFRYIPENF